MRTKKNKQQALKNKVNADSPYYDLIQMAYRTFKQAPTEHGVCDCCMYPEIRIDFFNHGQANLPLHYVKDWFFAAADMPLAKDKWRFLLPRVLEVLACGEEPSDTGIEVSLNRFQTGEMGNWNTQEWAVLDQFQRQFLAQAGDQHDHFLDDVICLFAIAGWPTDNLFEQVLTWPNNKLINKLWHDWCNCRNPSIWITAFWDDENIPRKFYTSDSLQGRINDYALSDDTPTDLANKAMAVADVIHRSCT